MGVVALHRSGRGGRLAGSAVDRTSAPTIADGTVGNNCDNPVNFSRFNDPMINKDFETGRTSTDPAVRKTAYEDINKEFAKQLWDGVGLLVACGRCRTRPTSHGILGPNLPTATSPDATADGDEPVHRSVERYRRVGALVEDVVTEHTEAANSARP